MYFACWPQKNGAAVRVGKKSIWSTPVQESGGQTMAKVDTAKTTPKDMARTMARAKAPNACRIVPFYRWMDF
eukprot:4602595-Amphidinium_carterae.1